MLYSVLYVPRMKLLRTCLNSGVTVGCVVLASVCPGWSGLVAGACDRMTTFVNNIAVDAGHRWVR